MIKHQNPKAGFTVLETLVAIMIIGLAIAGATTAAREGIRGGSIAKEEVRAFYLAQEALEAVVNKRDSNELYNYVNGGNLDWLEGAYNTANGVCSIGNKCYVDIWNGLLFRSCGGSSPVLKQNVGQPSGTGDGRYGYDSGAGWVNSPYTREIMMEKNGNNEVLLTINITWQHGTATKQFRTKTLLTNWFVSSSNNE